MFDLADHLTIEGYLQEKENRILKVIVSNVGMDAWELAIGWNNYHSGVRIGG